MKHGLQLVLLFLLMNVSFVNAACTHAANDNCANAIALTVNGTAVSGITCGTLETGELVDCAPTGTNQSVWYSFIATATNMAVSVVSTGTCYVSSAVWAANAGCPASAGCEALSCQSADNGPATTVHDLNNLIVGATYEIQIMYASGNGCGQDGSFTVQVTTAIPANPSNYLPLSTCSVPSGPACMFNYNATVAEVTANCAPYVSPGADTNANNVVRGCFTFTGQYSTNITFNNIIYGTCTALQGNVDWLDWELFDTTCTAPFACGNINDLSYSGIQCGQNYTMCYAYEIPDCTESEFYPYLTAIPPTFTGSSTPGTSTTGTTLNVSICKGASVVLKGQATGYVSYVWSPAAGLSSTTGASVTANPDTTTTYTLTGYDAGGCSQSKTIIVTVKPAPAAAITASPDSLTCTTTTVALTASGGGTYSWSGGNGTATTINVTTPNTYTVTVTGTNSCSTTATVSVAQNTTPPTLSITPPTPTFSCGVGSVLLTASGASTYSWNGGATTDTTTANATGTYTVTGTGTNGCTASASVTVTSSNSGITATATPTNATCGPTGSVTANPGGGTTYTYFWNNDSTTQTISNLPAGNYTVTVTGGGCTATASASVAQSSTPVTASATATPTGCTPSGSASVTPGGGGNYTYLWSNNGTTQTISNLAAGNYTVTVTSAGCTATASATVGTSGGAITLTPASTPASCSSNSGTAGVTPSGGSGYSYSWNTNATTSSISNLAAGTYTVTVTGTGGCSATASISVTISGSLTVSPTTVPASCGNNNGSATAVTTGGNGTYTYSWNTNATSETISNLAPGNYTVTVTGGGCTGTASVTISASTGLTLNTTVTNTSCGNNNGGVVLTVTGGSGTYTYIWSNNSTSGNINNLASGNYQVTVNDGAGCSGTASVTINPSGANSVTLTPASQTVCSGDTVTYCAPNGYAAYNWNTGDTSQCISTTFSGNYYLTATDGGGCTATSNQAVVANYTPTPVTISVNGDTLTSYSASSYQWFFNGQAISGATNAMYVATQTGNYTVQITDAHGCKYTSSVTTVKVTGINDVNAANFIKVYPNPLASGSWHVDVTEALIGATCQVFDANGQLVYKGELRNTQSEIALEVAQGIYVMQIHSADLNYNIKLIKLY